MTEDELAAALMDALESNIPGRPDGFRTARELMRDTGLHHNQILERLRILKEDDRLQVQKIAIENLVGTKQMVPAYKLVNGREVDDVSH